MKGRKNNGEVPDGKTLAATEGAPAAVARPVDSRAVVRVVQGEEKTRNAFSLVLRRLEKAERRRRYHDDLRAFKDQMVRTTVLPLETALVVQLEAECRLLDAWYTECPHPLPKTVRRNLRDVVTAKLITLVHEWRRTDFRPILEKYEPGPDADEIAESQLAASELLEEMMGIKVDPADLGGDLTAEKMAFLHEKYGEKIREAAEAGPPPRRMNKKQQQREAAREAAQELLDRDLKRLFKDLAVKLHPDREQDPVRKLEKEELMKILIRARDENDYTELLRLHVLYNDDATELERQLFSDSTLKTLVQLLREKAMGLEQSIPSLWRRDGLGLDILSFTEILPEDQAAVRAAVQRQADLLQKSTQEVAADLARIQADSPAFRKYLSEAIKEIRRQAEEDDWFF